MYLQCCVQQKRAPANVRRLNTISDVFFYCSVGERFAERSTVDTMEIIIFLRHIYFLTSYLSIDCMSFYFLLENSSIMYVESLILLEEGCKVKAVLGVYNSVEAAPYFFQSHPKNHPFHSLAHYCNQNVSRIYSNSDIHGQLCLL